MAAITRPVGFGWGGRQRGSFAGRSASLRPAWSAATRPVGFGWGTRRAGSGGATPAVEEARFVLVLSAEARLLVVPAESRVLAVGVA